MDATHRPQGFERPVSAASPGLHAGAALRPRTRRNPWLVVGFFGLVIAAWINSQM
jgi:hypothetical protein